MNYSNYESKYLADRRRITVKMNQRNYKMDKD